MRPESPEVGKDAGQYRLECYYDVELPDGRVQHTTVDPRAKGQVCLEQVCRSLGVFEESDYFGLTYAGGRGELLWVNTRNRLSQQVRHGCSLRLRVKFFVQPHMLVLDETRRLFFLEAKRRVAEEPSLWLRRCDDDDGGGGDGDADWTGELEPLVALLAQAQLGDCPDGADCPDYSPYQPAADASRVSEQHRRLSGLAPTAAEYRFLESVGRLPMYGCHYHAAKDCFEARLAIAVGPSAVCICRPDGRVMERIAYPRVQKVTISSRVLYFSLSRGDGVVKEVGYRLASRASANALYRCITESHSFFRCDTVRSGVYGQTCRDMKNAIVSLFVESDGSLAQNFVFDVRRTAKEVHDAARRRIHRCNAAAAAATAAATAAAAAPAAAAGNRDVAGSGCSELMSQQAELEAMKARLQLAQQTHLCRVCMDSSIGAVLIPCGHAATCTDCAERLTECPLCRESIAMRQPCHLPAIDN